MVTNHGIFCLSFLKKESENYIFIMGCLCGKNFKGQIPMWKFSQISCFLLLVTLLAACGDDSVSNSGPFSAEKTELSSERNTAHSSSSTDAKKKVSSSSTKNNSSASRDSISSDGDDENLDLIYVLVNGSVSGKIALESFAKSAQVSMVLLDSANGYKKTESSFAGGISKDRDYEIKKIDLYQPYVLFSVEGTFDYAAEGKNATASLWALGDVTSGEVFNMNLLTSLEAERALQLMTYSKNLYEEAKDKANAEVWDMFHLDAIDFDVPEMIDVADISESGAALLASTILLQAGANGDFAKFYKTVSADVVKDGKWDDATARLAIADWALATDIKDGFAAIRKSLEKKMKKVTEFEPYIKNFYLTELEFPKCGAENAGDVFFVKNKSSKFYASSYDDVTKSKDRFVCDEKSGWKAIPDSLKDFMGDATPAKDGEVRRGAFSGEFLVYDGTKKEWRKASAIEKDKYFVLNSNAKAFVDIQDVYESIKDDERVIFVLRHAERGDDTSKSGTLTDNGKKQSEEVGARLKKFKEDFVLGGSEFLRAHQTVMSIAKGRGQSYDTRDTIPQLNDDWYSKNAEAVEKAKNECGGGWEVTSKYAYTGAYSTGADAAYYNLAERSVELIENVLLKKYTKEKFVLLSSHDKLMVPLVAYCSNLNIEMKKYENNGKWINYLAGVAIIVDKAGNRRYVAVRGLTSGFAN